METRLRIIRKEIELQEIHVHEFRIIRSMIGRAVLSRVSRFVNRERKTGKILSVFL